MVEVLVSSLGFAEHVSTHYRGSKADLTIFRKELEKYKLNTKKYNESNASDNIV